MFIAKHDRSHYISVNVKLLLYFCQSIIIYF
nr:MAG TPA: hypothetical protein [Caudoviricetes sp.]